MKQYEVDYKIFGYVTIKVDANNIDEAVDKANETMKEQDSYYLGDAAYYDLYFCGTPNLQEAQWF